MLSNILKFKDVSDLILILLIGLFIMLQQFALHCQTRKLSVFKCLSNLRHGKYAVRFKGCTFESSQGNIILYTISVSISGGLSKSHVKYRKTVRKITWHLEKQTKVTIQWNINDTELNDFARKFYTIKRIDEKELAL